jgi:hypothetical protein
VLTKRDHVPLASAPFRLNLASNFGFSTMVEGSVVGDRLLSFSRRVKIFYLPRLDPLSSPLLPLVRERYSERRSALHSYAGGYLPSIFGSGWSRFPQIKLSQIQPLLTSERVQLNVCLWQPLRSNYEAHVFFSSGFFFFSSSFLLPCSLLAGQQQQ